MDPAAMAINQQNHVAELPRAQTVMAMGGNLGALAASSCCLLPLTLFSLGISGAWIANFTRLAPYQPTALRQRLSSLVPAIGSSSGLGNASVSTAKTAPARCRTGWSRPRSSLATVLVFAALGFDFLAPLLFNS
jgi:mercuric ion transport protein